MLALVEGTSTNESYLQTINLGFLRNMLQKPDPLQFVYIDNMQILLLMFKFACPLWLTYHETEKLMNMDSSTLK